MNISDREQRLVDLARRLDAEHRRFIFQMAEECASDELKQAFHAAWGASDELKQAFYQAWGADGTQPVKRAELRLVVDNTRPKVGISFAEARALVRATKLIPRLRFLHKVPGGYLVETPTRHPNPRRVAAMKASWARRRAQKTRDPQ